MDKGKKNMTKCLVDSIIRRSFVVRNLTNLVRIATYYTSYWRCSDARTFGSWGFANFSGQRHFFVPLHSENEINTMRNPVNSANEAKNSTLDRTGYTPKWVGTIGYLLILFCFPYEGEITEFYKDFIDYLFSVVPVGLFCVWASGGFSDIANFLKNK